MSNRAQRIAVATVSATLAIAGSITQAAGARTAKSAAGNALTATATLNTSYDPYNPTTAISGRILAGHKYGPRHCLSEREIWAYYKGVSGQTYSIDADRPTDKKGRFTFTQIYVEYGDADYNGTVPPSGGTVTYILIASPAHAPKRRGDILNTYKCHPVSTTVQVDVPPEPPT